MRCEQLLEDLQAFETAELPAPLREHLASCGTCRSYAEDWRLARAGFRLLASEALPELSPGFAARLLRHVDGLAEAGRSSEEFLERVGLRFVYASLLLTVTVLLALLLPSSGPLRARTTADLYYAGQEAFISESDPILTGERPAPTLPSVREGSEGRPK